jgi:hypothetical protein
VVGMTAWSWSVFGKLCHFRGGDVKCGQSFLWTPLVHPPGKEHMISNLYLQGDFDGCRADCGLNHCQYSHDHSVCGYHLFDLFLRGQGEVDLHLCKFP